MARSWKWRGPRRRRRPAEAGEHRPGQTDPDGRPRAPEDEPQPPLTRLLRAEPTHSREAGPSVLLRIAQGRTAVVVTAEQAEAMARELTDAAEKARRLPPQA